MRMSEHHKARLWRRARSLTVERLSELSGYSVEAIYALEQGRSTRKGGGKVQPWVWQRYRMCCAGIDAQIRTGINFEWGN